MSQNPILASMRRAKAVQQVRAASASQHHRPRELLLLEKIEASIGRLELLERLKERDRSPGPAVDSPGAEAPLDRQQDLPDGLASD